MINRKHLHNFALLALLFSATTLWSQTDRIEKANTEYENLNYISSIDIYTDVVESGFGDAKLVHRLASAHYFNGDYAKAAEWYGKFYAMEGARPTLVDNYRYGQSLKTQKQYQKADSLLSTYYASKGKAYASALDKVNDLSAIDNDNIFKLKGFQWNTDKSEYPAYINNDVAYVVGYNLDKVGGKKDRKTSDIYKVDMATGKYEPLPEEINSPYNEGSFTMTNDGKTLFFSRNDYHKSRIKKNSRDIVTINIYMATLKNGKWQNVKAFPYNSEEYSVGHPTLSADNKILYYISDGPGGKGGTDLYKVPFYENGTFGQPKNMGALNTVGNEMFPFVNRKNGDLYFSSNGENSIGGLDIFIAKPRNNIYERAYNLGEQINSTYDDFAFVMNADGLGYLSSNRVNEVGMDDIYGFDNIRDFQVPTYFNLRGTVLDAETQDPLANATVALYDKEGNKKASTVTDADGNYDFGELDASGLSYARIEKDGYQNTERYITESMVNQGKPMDIRMNKAGKELPDTLLVKGSLKDQSTGRGVAGATVTVMDIDNKVLAKGKSDQWGNYSFPDMPTEKVAFVRAEKADYQTEEVEADVQRSVNGVLDVDIQMTKDNVPLLAGSDIASILNPIYFDTGSSEIKGAAKTELEKLVKVLKRYPYLNIHIGAHTDSRSSNEFNLNLSRRRARSTYNYIVMRGVSPKRLSYRGYGETQLLNHCRNGVDCDDDEHRWNRRSSFTIDDGKGLKEANHRLSSRPAAVTAPAKKDVGAMVSTTSDIKIGSTVLANEENGYYVIANVFGVKGNADAFAKKMRQKGMDAGYLYNSARKLYYVYLEMAPELDAAKEMVLADVDGKYTGAKWILQVKN